jgi:hypothetical protein
MPWKPIKFGSPYSYSSPSAAEGSTGCVRLALYDSCQVESISQCDERGDRLVFGFYGDDPNTDEPATVNGNGKAD